MSSGATALESAVVITGADVPDPASLAAARDLGVPTVLVAGPDGSVRDRIT